MFDHEKLDAYRLSIDFIVWTCTVTGAVVAKARPTALKHLEESSTSVALNIAEGNGKRSMTDRVRFLEFARGSALECAACLDVLVARGEGDARASRFDDHEADRTTARRAEHEYEYEYEYELVSP